MLTDSKTPGSCSRPQGWAALQGELAARHCGCPGTPQQSQARRDVGFGEMRSILPHPRALPVPWPGSLLPCSVPNSLWEMKNKTSSSLEAFQVLYWVTQELSFHGWGWHGAGSGHVAGAV